MPTISLIKGSQTLPWTIHSNGTQWQQYVLLSPRQRVRNSTIRIVVERVGELLLEAMWLLLLVGGGPHCLHYLQWWDRPLTGDIPRRLHQMKTKDARSLNCKSCRGSLHLPGRFAMYPAGLNPFKIDGLRGLCGGSKGPLISRSTTRRTKRWVSVNSCTA